ncbi:hypothetical protein ABG088_09355 [Hydrogenibacillus schlegelii]|uniref:Uncharacterized protein n=1 Tax=Hydrogenibacillus schlegelii TaxID=1484 RepID=A0A2T5GCT7_HYDSH|nr:MAG: hypothetical protein HSCHL_0859 [Hydrogenibacillus schlegelii]
MMCRSAAGGAGAERAPLSAGTAAIGAAGRDEGRDVKKAFARTAESP